MKNFLIAALALMAVAAVCGTATAQGEAPQTTNAKLEVRQAGSNLSATMKQIVDGASERMWIGYEVEEIAGSEEECCEAIRRSGNGRTSGTFELEGESRHGNATGSDQTVTKLEGGRRLMILYRAGKAHIERIRFAPTNCRLDAGGLRLVWLEGVSAGQSVAFLSELVKSPDSSTRNETGMGEQALVAIALHADGAADRAMEGFAAPGQPEKLRERASFWMGTARGEAGLTALKRMARTDPDSQVREQVSFALFVSPEPGATDEMIRMAREDASAQVRAQALFWLARKAGQKAETAIVGAIGDDPDTEVKKKAVFALSQMPKDEGVPKLIEVAEKNKNPEVRKQAMFWLGQSGDPRALAFIEKILRD
jgi:HEAT repeat protein